jgi:cyclase
MRRDRVADGIYTFTSEMYAQATAGVIFTAEGTIVIDTLPFPSETREMMALIKERGQGTVRYVVNTHYHSDHTNGTYLFPDAEVIAHETCRDVLMTKGAASLEEAKRDTPALAEVRIRLPNVVFEQEMYIHLGERALHLVSLPGHTRDSIGLMVEGERILFAGDAVLPVPHIVFGDVQQTLHSLRTVRSLRPESVVQGHGQLLLKGELNEELESSTQYLEAIVEKVRLLVQQGAPMTALRQIDIESCGKSRVPLDGLVQYLHAENLVALYSSMSGHISRSDPPSGMHLQ